MSPGLLRSLAVAMAPTKLAAPDGEPSTLSKLPTRIIDKFGLSPGYQIGAGDVSDIPLSTKIKHSVMPWVTAGVVGGLGGLGAGHLLASGLDSTGVTEAGGAMSEGVHHWAPTVGAFAGTQMMHNSLLHGQFMQGVRDAKASRSPIAPWNAAEPSIRVPWKVPS